MKTQVIHTTKRYLDVIIFPLFSAILYDRYIPIQTPMITLVYAGNVMLMVPRELGPHVV